MSLSAALQKLIFDELSASLELSYKVGSRIYDRPVPNAAFPFISFGPTSIVPLAVDDCISGREETVQIDIWSTDQSGKLEAKQICDIVIGVLNGFEGEMESGYAVELRITLAQVIDDPDGKTSHGIVQVEAMIEEGV